MASVVFPSELAILIACCACGCGGAVFTSSGADEPDSATAADAGVDVLTPADSSKDSSVEPGDATAQPPDGPPPSLDGPPAPVDARADADADAGADADAVALRDAAPEAPPPPIDGGACNGRCPMFGDKLAYVSVDPSSAAAVIANVTQGGCSYACTLYFQSQGFNCFTTPQAGTPAEVYSLGGSSNCTTTFGNIGVAVNLSVPTENCGYSCVAH